MRVTNVTLERVTNVTLDMQTCLSMLCAGQSQDCPDPCFAHEQSLVCAANPWFIPQTMDPGFVPQTMDPGFAQDNPRIAQIHALRVKYMYKILVWANFVA